MDQDLDEEFFSKYFPSGDFSEEHLYEVYQNHPELFENLLRKQYEEMQQNYSVYNECVIPVFSQSYETMGNLVIFCFVLRVFSMLKLPRLLLHLMSLGFGCTVLWQFYQHSSFFVVLPIFILVIFYQFPKVHKGVHIFVSVVYILACEAFLNAVTWNKMKGSVMILLMKMLSVVMDNQVVDIVELTGYLFNPASVIFGPFIMLDDYRQLFSPQPISFHWLFRVLLCFIISGASLLWSSCGIPFYMDVLTKYLPMQEDNRWWTAYKDAQSFRFSHYFVSYFTEMCCVMMGVGSYVKIHKDNSYPTNHFHKDANEKNEKVSSNETPQNSITEFEWRKPVANLLQVEAPRSLVDVVTNWNLPMHFWLKQYVFKSTRQYGVLAAILSTYISSSLLHGLNFQLSAVLLSIGLFAYAEGVLRMSLASTFNACIKARPCKENCSHQYKKWHVFVASANLLFSFVAIWNLAYLGCVFDSSPGQELGYSMKHTLGKWKSYQFTNHIFMASCYAFHMLILSGRLF